MDVRTQWVSFGRPAAEALRRAISDAKSGEPLAPVTVVVPSNHVGVAARRLLASGALGEVCGRGAGLAAVTFLTVYRLGELLGAARLASHGRRPVSRPVIGAALRAALDQDAGVFAPVRTHPATEAALVEAYRELRDLSSEALGALSGQSARAADVVRLHHAARRGLSASWYDEEDLLDAAADELRRGVPATAGLGSVVVHLPERISRHGAGLLRAVAERHPTTIVAGTCGDERADAETARSVALVRGFDAAAPDGRDAMAVVDAERTRIVTVSDPDEEVRAGLRAVVAAARRGTPLDRMAMFFADAEPYGRVVHEQLGAAGIAVNGTAVMPLRARLAGRALLGLLALPEAGFRRDDVFAYLAGAPVRHEGRPVPATAWERLSREAGIVAGREQWDERLLRLAEERDVQAEQDEHDPEAPPWRAARNREDAQRARALRAFVLGLIDDLRAAAGSAHSWPDWARWARRYLEALLGAERVRAGWSREERRAAERVERALDRVSGLGEVEGPVPLDVFTRTLELELDADLARVGRMGEGVFVGPISMGVGLDLDLVVVLGLAEGVFPSTPRDDSLLPDRERQASGGELPLRTSVVERRHRQLLAALASASRQLLCVPRGDLRGSRERVPSRWVLHIAGALDGGVWYSEDLFDPERAARSALPWLEHVPSFDAGLRAVDFPSSAQEYRLRSLLAAGAHASGSGSGSGAGSGSGSASGSGEASGSGDRLVTAGSAALAARRSPRFTRFDGNLGAVAVPSPVERVVSATQLEGWAVCPFAYLMRVVLGVEEVENPEDELRITPMERGSLVHAILAAFVDEVVSRPGPQQPKPHEPWTPADRARLLVLAERSFGEYEGKGLTGRPVFWHRERRRIKAELLRVLDEDDRHRRTHRTRPVAAELPFGLPGSQVGVVPFALPEGRAVSFRGQADRVDVSEDESVYVVDYKTGRPDDYSGLSEEQPDLGGRKLQLAVYGEAARAFLAAPAAPVQADYWFTSTRGRFKRIGYQVTREVVERVGRTLDTIVSGIEDGVFPQYSRAPSTHPWVECAYCDPDGLGVADLRRAWARKANDPALAGFRRLAEPDAGGEEHGDGAAAPAADRVVGELRHG